MSIDDLIKQYKILRTERDMADAKYKVLLGDVTRAIEATLRDLNLWSVKTESGHAITSVRRSVRVVDWGAFAAFADAEDPALVKQGIDNSEALRLLDDNVAIPGTEVQLTHVLTIK